LVRTTPYNTVGSDVAIDSLGNFVVTWSELISNTGNNFDVFARRYASTGAASGPAFRVNTYTAGLQVSSWVAMNAAGSFVIAWTSHEQTGTYSWNVYAQRYNATGTMQGGEFQVNVETSYVQPTVGVALASNGSFVITWRTDNTPVTPSLRPYILARNYAATGAAHGAPFAVSTTTTMGIGVPYAATDPEGNVVIAWDQYITVESDVYARRFMPVGAVAQVLPNPGQMNSLSGATGSWQYYKITVPTGHATLDASIFGSIGDADLYLRFGALPTSTRWDARPYINGSNESVRMQGWPAGDWYIGIYGYSGYSSLILQGVSY
jgi:Bacterial pre-peptidase C-terminal domain